MKYNRILQGIAGLAAFALMAAGCQNEELGNGTEVTGSGRIVLSLSDGGRELTRAASKDGYTTPTETEKAVTHFDVFVIDDGEDVVYYERATAPATGDKMVLSQAKNKFAENTSYTVYVVANCKEKTAEELGEIKTLTQLKGMEVTTSNVHVTGLDAPEATDVPTTFMMDGHSAATVLNDGNTTTNKKVSVVLRRAAAKITVILQHGEHTSFLPMTNDVATSGTMSRRVINFARKTSVLQPDNEADYENKPLFTNTGYSTVGIEQADQADGTAAETVAVTVYSYSNDWTNDAAMENESYLLMRIPVTYQEDESTEAETRVNNYYKIPVSGNGNHSLKRNHSYFITATIDGLGGENDETPVTLQPAFFKVQDWVPEEIQIGGDGQDHPEYLTLSMDTLRINNASTDNTVLFASSSTIPRSGINVDRVYIINKFGQEQEVTNHGVTVTTEVGLNGRVTINSKLPENSLSIRYIVLTIENADGQEQTLVVEQYPLEYVTNTQGWYSYRDDFDNGRGTPTTYIERGTSPYNIGARSWNGSSWIYSHEAGSHYDFFASKVVTTYNKSGNNAGKSAINYYSWYSYSGSWGSWGYNISDVVVKGDEVFSSNTGNARMYHVQITSTPKNDVDYVLGLPRMNDAGYTDDGVDNAKIVSPSFMIASQLGAVQAAESVEQAASHCAQYVEVTNRGNKTDNTDVVAYHDWRLPTKAEINIIYKYQTNSDAMDEVLSGDQYWSASGLVPKPGESDPEDQAIRCIRDAYRDGESK